MKKVILIICTVILFLLMIIPIPIKIDRTVSAMEFNRSNKNYQKTVTVTFSGTYYWKVIKLFGSKDKWNGRISVSGYPVTGNQNLSLIKDKAKRITYGEESVLLVYFKNLYDASGIFFGSLYTTKFFKHFAILVDNKQKGITDSSISNQYIIVGNATDKESALKELKFVDFEYAFD